MARATDRVVPVVTARAADHAALELVTAVSPGLVAVKAAGPVPVPVSTMDPVKLVLLPG